MAWDLIAREEDCVWSGGTELGMAWIGFQREVKRAPIWAKQLC